MDKWEYMSFSITWDKVKGGSGKDWVVNWSDAPQTVGMRNILDSYGSGYWELMNMVGEYLEKTIMGDHYHVQRYRAFQAPPAIRRVATARFAPHTLASSLSENWIVDHSDAAKMTLKATLLQHGTRRHGHYRARLA